MKYQLLIITLLSVLLAFGCTEEKKTTNTAASQNTEVSQTNNDQKSDATSQDPSEDNTQKPTETESAQTETKSLVAYFSVTHNTKPIAEYISEHTGATLYEIVPEHPYTDKDINYGDSSSRTSIEQNDPNARPAIASTIDNIEQYDIIYLGYPIWWEQAPKIMYTFLESVSIKEGATIVPFCTSGSSGIGTSATNLAKSASSQTGLKDADSLQEQTNRRSPNG